MTKKIIYLFLAMLIAGAAAAQDVSIRADHPDEYVVVEGDTLWDISGRFLDQPWQWPAIWHVNPQINNPHLIYPGDVVSLRYIDGKPYLMVNDGVERLSPEVRRSGSDAIPPIPLDEIEPFFRHTWVVGEAEYDSMGYVIANYEERINALTGVNTYARAVDVPVGGEVVFLRAANVYWDVTGRGDDYRQVRRVNPRRHHEHAPTSNDPPWFGGEIIGYELWEVARGVVVKQGDPAIIELQSGRTEVTATDRVVAARDPNYPPQFQPHALEPMPEGLEVVSVLQNRFGVGQLQMVAINAGSRQGIEEGHVFSAFRPGGLRAFRSQHHDDVKYPKGTFRAYKGDARVSLPDEFDAHIMVFRVFDDISFALVMNGKRAVTEWDVLKHPDEVL